MPAMTEYPEYYGYDIPGAKQPELSGALASVRARQKKMADEYRAGIPELSDRLYGQAEKQSRGQLAEDINNVRRDFNRRGMLYSGRRMAGEAGARAGAEQGLLQTRQNINQALYNRGNAMESGVFQTDLGIAGNAPGLGASSLSGLGLEVQDSLANLQAQQSIFTGAGQGLGQLAGTIAANQRDERRGYSAYDR